MEKIKFLLFFNLTSIYINSMDNNEDQKSSSNASDIPDQR